MGAFICTLLRRVVVALKFVLLMSISMLMAAFLLPTSPQLNTIISLTFSLWRLHQHLNMVAMLSHGICQSHNDLAVERVESVSNDVKPLQWAILKFRSKERQVYNEKWLKLLRGILDTCCGSNFSLQISADVFRALSSGFQITESLYFHSITLNRLDQTERISPLVSLYIRHKITLTMESQLNKQQRAKWSFTLT